MHIWMVRADGGTLTQDFLSKGYVGIGWPDIEPLAEGASRDSIEAAYLKAYPDDARMRRAINVGQLYRFLTTIQEGDIVLTPGTEGRMHTGKVKTGVLWKEGEHFPRQRPVDWSLPVFSRWDASIPLQNSLRSSQSIFGVQDKDQVLTLLGQNVTSSGKTAAISAINNDELVRKRLLELDATSFELLVAYTLRSIGFEASQQTGKVGDKGVDYSGELDVFGVAAVKLKVQVKRYDYGTIKEGDIRSLRGALDRDQEGCFITLSTYAKSAKEAAEDPNKKPIRLIDGSKFIEIFTEQYEKVRDIAIEEDNKEMFDLLKFKKGLIPE
jgi:restriction system protein